MRAEFPTSFPHLKFAVLQERVDGRTFSCWLRCTSRIGFVGDANRILRKRDPPIEAASMQQDVLAQSPPPAERAERCTYALVAVSVIFENSRILRSYAPPERQAISRQIRLIPHRIPRSQSATSTRLHVCD